jgi:hypothetical protein
MALDCLALSFRVANLVERRLLNVDRKSTFKEEDLYITDSYLHYTEAERPLA